MKLPPKFWYFHAHRKSNTKQLLSSQGGYEFPRKQLAKISHNRTKSCEVLYSIATRNFAKFRHVSRRSLVISRKKFLTIRNLKCI
jgi:hypothetical protein